MIVLRDLNYAPDGDALQSILNTTLKDISENQNDVPVIFALKLVRINYDPEEDWYSLLSGRGVKVRGKFGLDNDICDFDDAG